MSNGEFLLYKIMMQGQGRLLLSCCTY